MIRDRNSKLFWNFAAEVMILLFAGGVIYSISSKLSFKYLFSFSRLCSIFGIFQVVCYVIYRAIQHKIYKGIKYAFHHNSMIKRTEKTLLDCNYYLEKFCGMEKVAVLPKIKIVFRNHCEEGTLYIQNHPKFDKGFSDLNISSALGKFIAEKPYLTDDENWYAYQFADYRVNRQQVFIAYEEFYEYSKQFDDYTLFIDRSHVFPLHHALICGQTGSGKSYSLLSLLMQMHAKSIAYNIYFADPKMSDVSVLGKKIVPERTADDIDSIIDLLRNFYNKMEERKIEMNRLLSKQLGANYSTFKLAPFVLVFDEYLSFISALAKRKKEIRDEVQSIMEQIILQGRQLGFFVFLVMQQAPAKQLDTSIRDNLVLKCVLGKSDNQTYVTAFGTGADIPKREYTCGQGIYTYSGMTKKPTLCAFPLLKFDVLTALTSDNGTGVM